ncbi:hypothetical protein AURDEDRAFT_167595 [Auricularia subglabra TFB-10046 SS5]|nr:hypothetical protein AURDEDRAFT_167595 [Auricularia subglabra TFB-10046 SS5]
MRLIDTVPILAALVLLNRALGFAPLPDGVYLIENWETGCFIERPAAVTGQFTPPTPVSASPFSQAISQKWNYVFRGFIDGDNLFSLGAVTAGNSTEAVLFINGDNHKSLTLGPTPTLFALTPLDRLFHTLCLVASSYIKRIPRRILPTPPYPMSALIQIFLLAFFQVQVSATQIVALVNDANVILLNRETASFLDRSPGIPSLGSPVPLLEYLTRKARQYAVGCEIFTFPYTQENTQIWDFHFNSTNANLQPVFTLSGMFPADEPFLGVKGQRVVATRQPTLLTCVPASDDACILILNNTNSAITAQRAHGSQIVHADKGILEWQETRAACGLRSHAGWALSSKVR